MNNFISKFIIIVCFISLHILFMPKMSSSANCCTPMSCNRNSSLTNDDIISISFPFRVKDHQSESCGSPGFDMYCDNELGPFIELPKAGNFSVGSIYYYSDFRQIELSDADDCLPRKLLNLDLTTTPLRVISQSKDFKVYNCSGFGKSYALHIEKIDCLSGSNYTVISASGSSSRVTDSDCRFLKDVSVPSLPTFDRLNSELSSYSSIYLTWDEQTCTLQGPNRRTWLIAITILVCIVIGVSCVLFIWLSTRNDERQAAVVTTTNTNNVVSPGQSSTRSDLHTSSLDQITINSYPMVVIGQSRRLIKPHDDKCPICLTDYVPGDTLKILPDCLHRFHVDCIDLWLSSKPTCPICRISPPHNNC